MTGHELVVELKKLTHEQLNLEVRNFYTDELVTNVDLSKSSRYGNYIALTEDDE